MAKKHLSIAALLVSGALVPACIILDRDHLPFDPPDADPCPDAQVWPDAGDPPWDFDAQPLPDARVWPDAPPPGVASSSPDAYPWDAPGPSNDAWPSDNPCHQDPVPDANNGGLPDAAVGVIDAS